jgi:UDP-2,4-diacetamido-2,4,6-trideoxy-beta-L-altropyranose hydrolase
MTETRSGARPVVAIRADASIQIGSGHVMRCLTLAEALRERGAAVHFICRNLPGHLGGVLADQGYPVHWLPAPVAAGTALPAHTAHSAWLGVPWTEDAEQTRERLAGWPEIDWLIVDHYALDRAWESRMRPLVKGIMVIDDLADRPHDCDLLLDQNLYEDMDQRYGGLVPADCRLLLGPRYALLRPEFREARQTLRQRDGGVRRILVFFGGADPSNETAKALRAIQRLERPEIAVDVVVGAANPHRAEIEALCAALLNARFHCQVDNMAELMARADLAIGASGVSTWERAALGLPALVVTVAENQKAIAYAADDNGLLICLGDKVQIKVTDWVMALRKVLSNPDVLVEMSSIALFLNDGQGVKTVMEILEA